MFEPFTELEQQTTTLTTTAAITKQPSISNSSPARVSWHVAFEKDEVSGGVHFIHLNNSTEHIQETRVTRGKEREDNATT
jgi:hypothetical protein